MDSGLALDSLRNIDMKADTVLAHGHAEAPRHRSTTCCAENAVWTPSVCDNWGYCGEWTDFAWRARSWVYGVYETEESISMATAVVVVGLRECFLDCSTNSCGEEDLESDWTLVGWFTFFAPQRRITNRNPLAWRKGELPHSHQRHHGYSCPRASGAGLNLLDTAYHHLQTHSHQHTRPCGSRLCCCASSMASRSVPLGASDT